MFVLDSASAAWGYACIAGLVDAKRLHRPPASALAPGASCSADGVRYRSCRAAAQAAPGGVAAQGGGRRRAARRDRGSGCRSRRGAPGRRARAPGGRARSHAGASDRRAAGPDGRARAEAVRAIWAACPRLRGACCHCLASIIAEGGGVVFGMGLPGRTIAQLWLLSAQTLRLVFGGAPLPRLS